MFNAVTDRTAPRGSWGKEHQMKTRKLYSVRIFAGNAYSKPVGFKMRLLDRRKAMRVCRRLKRAGLTAVAAPVSIAR